MDEIILSLCVDNVRTIHIASLSRKSIIDNEAEHLGFDGYFLFEEVNSMHERGINILAKSPSYDAAIELAKLLVSFSSHKVMAA